MIESRKRPISSTPSIEGSQATQFYEKIVSTEVGEFFTLFLINLRRQI